MEQGNYDRNLKAGIWYEYNEQTHIHSKGHYSYGKRMGRWEFWDDNNQIVDNLFYVVGQQ